jgi:hypothetical protein
MRRLMAAAACTAVLFLGAGCGNNSEQPSAIGSASAAPAPASASPTADAAANTKQVCADVKQTNADYSAKITAAFAKVTQSMMKGDEAAGQKNIDEMNALTREWVDKVRAQAAKANNPELKAAADNLATQLKTLESANASMNDMNKMVQDATATLAKFCG